MAYTSHAIANEFLRLTRQQGKQLTNMQLQKLVFLAQGYALAVQGNPIHNHDTRAWQWGPVIPKLYKSLQKFGSNVVTEDLKAEDVIDDNSDEARIIKAVLEAYGDRSGSELLAITHQANTPWSKTWEKKQFSIIDNALIANYYKSLLQKAVGEKNKKNLSTHCLCCKYRTKSASRKSSPVRRAVF